MESVYNVSKTAVSAICQEVLSLVGKAHQYDVDMIGKIFIFVIVLRIRIRDPVHF